MGSECMVCEIAGCRLPLGARPTPCPPTPPLCSFPLPATPSRSRRYPEGGITRNNSMIGQMGKNCEHLTAQYTLEGMEAMAPAPAPAPATATDAPAPTPVSGAATLRASAALLAAAVAAALLF